MPDLFQFNPLATKPPKMPGQANYCQTAQETCIKFSPPRNSPTVLAEQGIMERNGWEDFCAIDLREDPLS